MPSAQSTIDHLLRSMEDLGLSGKVVEVVRDIYTGSTTRITAGTSHSEPISCARGVKQGCPLSPILFNLAVEQLLRGVEGLNGGYLFDEFTLKVLAYADDLCLVASTPEELQAMLRRAEEFASSGLHSLSTSKSVVPFTVRDQAEDTLWQRTPCT